MTVSLAARGLDLRHPRLDQDLEPRLSSEENHKKIRLALLYESGAPASCLVQCIPARNRIPSIHPHFSPWSNPVPLPAQKLEVLESIATKSN
jgi:hypothetical protein